MTDFIRRTGLILCLLIQMAGLSSAGQVYVDPIDGRTKSLPGSIGGSGTITSVLGDTAGDVPMLWQNASTLPTSTPQPTVTTSSHWVTGDAGPYTDFLGTPPDSAHLFILCLHEAVFDLTSSGIEAWNRPDSDLTASIGFVAHLVYSDVDDQWHFVNCPDKITDLPDAGFIALTGSNGANERTFQDTSTIEWANPTGASGDPSAGVVAGSIGYSHLASTAKFQSLAIADLGDTSTPSVLTIGETTNKCISNYKSTGADHVFTMPAAHINGNIMFIVGDEFQVDIEPDSGDNFYLNGTAMAADEHIQNTADTLGEYIVGYCANINGTLKWMFESKYTNFVEETL